jgi:UDP-N-acetylglucosamine acyltransferase
MSTIHPTAIISKGAQIAPSVEIGPYCVVGPEASIGEGTRLGAGVVIEGHTRIGERCQIHAGAVLGGFPQDKRFDGKIRSGLVIGSDNIIREHVTIHRGSKEGADTVVGDRNFLMIGCHIAHDCHVGNDIILSNASVLAGHVTVEDQAVISALSGVHQFVRVGRLSMTGGICKVIKDILPFGIHAGVPADFYGINSVGLKRAGFTPERRQRLKETYRILFRKGTLLKDAIQEARHKFGTDADVQHVLKFMESTKRGTCRPPRGSEEQDLENALVE